MFERVYKVACDTVMAVCAIIVTYYTIWPRTGTPTAATSAVSPVSSPPWWIIAIGAIGVLLLITRWGPPLVRSLRRPSHRLAEFFPDRLSLQGFSGGSLGARLGSVDTACAIMVNGLDYYSSGINTHCIKKLLLPNPEGDALKSHAAVSSHPGQAEVIKETTQLAKKARAAVRWYDHFIYHSIILADTDKSSGWIQVESVLPYSDTSRRPSYTIFRKSSEAVVLEMQRVFNEIWDHAKPQ
jgi:hypothetical protein